MSFPNFSGVETPESLRYKLERLSGEERLSVEAVKGAAQVVNDPTTGQTVIVGPGGAPIKTRQAISSTFRLPSGTSSAALGANANGYNCWCQHPLKRGEDVIGCRVRMRNCSTAAPLEVTGIKVAADVRHRTTLNNSSLLEWSNFITFAGSQSVSVPAAVTGTGADVTNNIIPSLSAWSDPVWFKTKERLDEPSAPRLMRFAAHVGPSSRLVSFATSIVTALNSSLGNPGYKIASYTTSGLLSELTSNGYYLTEDGGQYVLLDVDWIYAGSPPLSMWTFGDSTFAAVLGSGTNLLGQQSLVATSNHAQSGQTLEDSHSTLRAVVANSKPDYVYLAGISANSPLTDSASLRAQQNLVMTTLMWLLEKGITPILRSPVAYSGVPAALIAEQDAWVRRLPAAIKLLDLREFSTAAWTLKTEYQSSAMDGTHWNPAAYAYEVDKLREIVI